ncbi:unnamed protein product [Parnassius mnemosyne]|uniref:CCHC-type domain-containing protein n=1 Tax=Parnassius mnemosyne TaxID=213953 RepID=A0AAV1M614_9NEOP
MMSQPEITGMDVAVSQSFTAAQNISQLAKDIITCIQNGKSVTAERKSSIINMANEIMQLSTRIEASSGSTDSGQIQSIIKGCIKEEIAILKTELKQPSYAHIVKSTPAIQKAPEQRRTKHALIVTAKTENKKETVEAWRKSFSFKNTTFAPSKVTPLSNTKLCVEFDTAEQRDYVIKNINENESKVTVQAAKKLRPMIQLKGISKDVPVDELVDIFKRQNPSINDLAQTDTDIVLRFQRKNKNNDLYNAVLIVTPPIWKNVIKMERVNIDHQKIYVEQFSAHLQCFKCLQFGHIKKFCTSDTQPCSHCASQTHTFVNCPNKNNEAQLCCINCNTYNQKHKTTRDTKHSATSNTCPTVRTMIARAIEKTDYGY